MTTTCVFFTGCTIFSCFESVEDTLEIVDAKDVTRIDIETNSISNTDDINTILDALLEAKMDKSMTKTMSDSPPFGENVLAISPVREYGIYGEVFITLYLFKDGGSDYIWGNAGVYRVSSNCSELIRQIYSRSDDN
jgi:hypothetical protein